MTDELTELTDLSNIGPVLAQKLHRAGIDSYEDLADLGSVEAYLKIWDHEAIIGYNMLYALEGSIQSVRWHKLSREHRQMVKEELLTVLESKPLRRDKRE